MKSKLPNKTKQVIEKMLSSAYRHHASDNVGLSFFRKTTELTAANERLQQEVAERKKAEQELKKYWDELQQRVEEQTAELTSANEQLQHEITERKEAEERFKQDAAERTAANEQLQREISERKEAEDNLNEGAVELTAANEQLQREISERKEAEEDLKREAAELTATNEQLQHQIAEHEQAEDELRGHREKLEQRVETQTAELTAANEQLQHEMTNVELMLVEALETLEVKCRVLGEGHLDTLRSMNNLAYCLNDLAWLEATHPLAELRNGAKSTNKATKACELTNWKNAGYVDTLAAAYAETGDFDSAVKWQKESLDLLPEKQRPVHQNGFEERLKLYQVDKPYREIP